MLGYAIFYNMRVSWKKECTRKTLPITFLRFLLPVLRSSFIYFFYFQSLITMLSRENFFHVLSTQNDYRSVIFLSRCFPTFLLSLSYHLRAISKKRCNADALQHYISVISYDLDIINNNSNSIFFNLILNLTIDSCYTNDTNQLI